MTKHDPNEAKSDGAKLNEIYTLFTDENFGFAKIIKRHDKTLYGNGWPGLVVQVLCLWGCVLLLAVDNPTVKAIAMFFMGR